MDKKKITRRVVLGVVIGGLAAGPFVIRHFRKMISKLEESAGIVRMADLLQEPRLQFFDEWKALRKPFLAELKTAVPQPDKVVLRPDLSKPLKWNFRMLNTGISGNWADLDTFAGDRRNAENAFYYTTIEGVISIKDEKLYVDVAKNELKMIVAKKDSNGKSPVITGPGGGSDIVLAIDGKQVSAKNKQDFFLCGVDTQQLATGCFAYEISPEDKPLVKTVISEEKLANGRTRTRTRMSMSSRFYNGRAGLLILATRPNDLPSELAVVLNFFNGALLHPYLGEYHTNTIIQLPNRKLFSGNSAEPINIRVDSVKVSNKIRSISFSGQEQHSVGTGLNSEYAFAQGKMHHINIDNGLACRYFNGLTPSDTIVNAYTQFTEFLCSSDEKI